MTIRLVTNKGKENCDLSFTRQVKEKSQAGMERCYQCLACSSGCPVAYAMDYTPNQLIRMIQLGLKQRVLTSSTIWLCASCETCVARCPNEVDITGLMNTLRYMALAEGASRRKNPALTFHTIFLGNVRSFGRAHELSMIVRYIIASGNMFKPAKLAADIPLGAKMFLRGRLAIMPSRVKGLKELSRIFKLCRG